jgi:hypothetical protein
MNSRQSVKFVSKSFRVVRGSPHPACGHLPHPMRRRESTLLTVIARGKSRFPPEELCEMAGIGVADVKGDFHHALYILQYSDAAPVSPRAARQI